MAKYFIFIVLIFNSKILLSQPSGLILDLMDEKVSHLTYGMLKCELRVEKEVKEIDNILYKFNKNFEVYFNNCYYGFKDNKIRINYFIGERTSSTTIDPNPQISNEQCANILKEIRGQFVFMWGDEVYNIIVQEFGNAGYSTQIDKDIKSDLKDYIEIYTGSGSGTRCKSKLDYDAEILFLQ